MYGSWAKRQFVAANGWQLRRLRRGTFNDRFGFDTTCFVARLFMIPWCFSMSIEAHVFTADRQAIAIADLARDMATVQVCAKILRDFRDWSTFKLIESGYLESGDIVCGWLAGASVASEIGTALTTRHRESCEAFVVEGNLGACSVCIRDLTNVPAEERIDLAEVEGEEEFAEAMSRASLDYDAHTASGRNDLSILLQFRLTQVIAKQRGGVWTDPVSGDYLVVSKGRWELLPCLAAFENQ
jgi:hypothetical protein